MALPVVTDESIAVTAVNFALAKIGVTKSIVTLADPSREARSAALVYNRVYLAVLRHFPWAFATKYLDLTLHSGSSTVPVVGDWQYAYVYPSDCVFARRIVTILKRSFEAHPITFRVSRILGAKVILSDLDDQTRLGLSVPSVELEYTAIFDCPTDLGDELFMDTFSWRLASVLAPGLSKMPNMATTAWAMYLHTLPIAAGTDANEGQLEPPGEAAYIRDGWDGGN